jgi:uncharacterized protein YggE
MRATRVLIPALAALALAGGFVARPVRAQEQPAGIRVRGESLVAAKPDIAFLGIGASVRRPTAGEAFGRAEELVATLTASLKANGVADRDIQTRQFSLNPEYGRPIENNPPPIIGWRALHTLSVKLRDFARIGGTIDEAVATLDGDVVLQGISFAIEDTDALATRARAEAIANARTKAEEMAARAGVRVGKLVFLQEISAPSPTPVRNAEGAGQKLAAPAGAPAGFTADVSPGELTISVVVEAIFAID